MLESANLLLEQITGHFVAEILFAGTDVNFCWNWLHFLLESANFLIQHITGLFVAEICLLEPVLILLEPASFFASTMYLNFCSEILFC